MRIQLKWFLTGKITPLEERDDLLGPNTTVWEVKGLVQLAYTYPAKNMLLIQNKVLVENDETLLSLGIKSQDEAMLPEHVLTIHVLSKEEMEEDGEEDGENGGLEAPANPGGLIGDTTIEQYSHDDFMKACKMLGRDVPVSGQRQAAVKVAPPRARPAFVDALPANTAGLNDTAEAPAGSDDPAVTKVKRIYEHVLYGLRKKDVEKKYGVTYPGVEETFDFWDLRLNHDRSVQPGPGELSLDLFYFGEIKLVDGPKFQALVIDKLKQHGFRVQPVGQIREAGCMYPLISIPALMSSEEAFHLGDEIFERFGNEDAIAGGPPTRAAAGTGPAGDGKAECCVM